MTCVGDVVDTRGVSVVCVDYVVVVVVVVVGVDVVVGITVVGVGVGVGVVVVVDVVYTSDCVFVRILTSSPHSDTGRLAYQCM